MAAIPTVGAQGVHAVQLSPRLRKLLHRRAAAAARREAAPVLAADRAALRIPRQEYRTAAASNKAATGAIASSLAQTLAGLDSSGLKGRYRQETAQGLKEQQAQALAALPYLNAIAQEDRAKGMTEGRTQLAQDRASMLQNAAQGFNSLLASARSTGSQTEKEREGRERSHRQEVQSNEREHLKEAKENLRERHAEKVEVPEAVENDFHVALTGYNALVEHEGEESAGGEVIHPPRTNAEWAEYVAHVEKEAGQGNRLDAEAAVRKLRERLAKEKKVYGGLGWALSVLAR